mgnify:CR=1 FL=1
MPKYCWVVDNVIIVITSRPEPIKNGQVKPWREGLAVGDNYAQTLRDIVIREKWDEYNEYRKTVLLNGFEFDGKRFDAKDETRTNLLGILQALALFSQLPQGFNGWRAADNTVLPMDAVKLQQFGAHMMNFTNQVYQKSFELKEKLLEISDPDAILAVDVRDGW